MASADELLRQIREGVETGVSVNELLTKFHEGLPLDRLRPLLRSRDDRVARVGTWLASELGAAGAPLLPDVLALLHHSDRSVRFDALGIVLASAGAHERRPIAEAILLVVDPDEAVSWQALQFLARASDEQLVASVPVQQHEDVARLTAWLTESHSSGELIDALTGSDKLTRRFAAAAAARTADLDGAPLQAAAAVADQTIARFARSRLTSAG